MLRLSLQDYRDFKNGSKRSFHSDMAATLWGQGSMAPVGMVPSQWNCLKGFGGVVLSLGVPAVGAVSP